MNRAYDGWKAIRNGFNSNKPATAKNCNIFSPVKSKIVCFFCISQNPKCAKVAVTKGEGFTCRRAKNG